MYSSVDRGGDERSWENATPIPHFQSKYQIERHLREKAGNMKWSIVRPVAFMDNLQPGMQTRVFLAAMRGALNGKKVQWIATKDIGVFVAMAFDKPDQWNHKAVGLAGDELTYDQVVEATGGRTYATFGILGTILMTLAKELATMINWFAAEGYGADITALKKMHPRLLDMKTWTAKESNF